MKENWEETGDSNIFLIEEIYKKINALD